MRRFIHPMFLAAAGLILLLSGGCTRHILPVQEPVWHEQASGIYRTSAGKRFYGVGRAAGIRNTMLLKATAGNAARKEMGRVLQDYVAALAQAAAPLSGGSTPSSEASAQLRGLVVRNAVQRSIISDHYAPGPSRLLALCELDLETLKAILQDGTLPQADVRRAMLQAADRVHRQLSGDFQSD